jgi:DNA-binding NarL/FixJ family response regulator
MLKSVIRVLCVDDHRVVREGIASMIGRQEDMSCVAAAGSGEQALALFREHRPDVTLMDLQLPLMTGLQTIWAIRGEYPDARIVVLTMYHGDEDIFRALDAGAASYLLKDALSHDLVHVVREVHAGRRPIPAAIAERLANRASYPALTRREIDVVELIAKGARNKEIGARLGISEETVKVHVKSLLAKLNVNDRAAAITVALQRGIIHLP